MSTIGSTSYDTRSLLAQQLQAQQAGQHRPPDAASRRAALEAALKAAGADPNKVQDIEKQIEDVIASAKDNQTGSTDSRTAIRQAVADVLKQNGIDPAKFEQQLRAGHAGHRGHHHRAGGASSAPSSVSTAPATQETSETAAAELSEAPDGDEGGRGLNVVA